MDEFGTEFLNKRSLSGISDLDSSGTPGKRRYPEEVQSYAVITEEVEIAQFTPEERAELDELKMEMDRIDQDVLESSLFQKVSVAAKKIQPTINSAAFVQGDKLQLTDIVYNDFVKFAQDTAEVASEALNTAGYHIMVGVPFLRRFAKDNGFEVPGKIGLQCTEWESATTVFQVADGLPVFEHSVRQFLFFVGWLMSSTGFVADFNAQMDSAVFNGGHDKCKRLRFRNPPFNGNCSVAWSLEGLAKHSALEGGINKMHFHAIVKFPKTLNGTQFNHFKQALITMLGSDITITPFRVIKQVKYIFKEKSVLGLSRFSGQMGNTQIVYSQDAYNFDNCMSSDFYSCCLCDSITEEKRVDFAEAIGYDMETAQYYFDHDNALFTRYFKNMDAFKAYLASDQMKLKGVSFRRLKSSIQYRLKLLARQLFLHLGDAQLADRVLREIIKLFIVEQRSYAFIGNVIQPWIKANSAADMVNEHQTYRGIFALGGVGSSGKTTIATKIHRGVCMPFENVEFGRTIGRGKFTDISLVNFYDEAPVNGSNYAVRQQEVDILMDFAEFEGATSHLWSSNSAHSQIKCVMVASAALLGQPPTLSAFSKYKTKDGKRIISQLELAQAYQNFREMTERRFFLYRLSGPQEFLVPYYEYFYGVGVDLKSLPKTYQVPFGRLYE